MKLGQNNDLQKMRKCLGTVLIGSEASGKCGTIYYMRPENPPIDYNPGQPRDTPFIKTTKNALLRGTLKYLKSLV